mgnify:CR=1 FL=1
MNTNHRLLGTFAGYAGVVVMSFFLVHCGNAQDTEKKPAYDPLAMPRTASQENNQQQGASAQHPLALPRALDRVAPGSLEALGGQYWYLPYAMVTEKQGLAFAKAYKKLLEEGKPAPEELTVEPGAGAAGSNTLHALSEKVERYFIRDINDPAQDAVSQSDIPMIIAKPAPGDNGANVLYMDGHVKFVLYDTFPVTRNFIQALSEIDPREADNG